jgi:transposase
MPAHADKFTLPPLVLPSPEVVLPEVLPTDAAALTALLLAQQEKYQAAYQAAYQTLQLQAQNHIQHLYEQVLLLRHRHFGVSSEQSSTQPSLFDEAETLAQDSTTDQDVAPLPPAQPSSVESVPPAEKKARGKRRPLSAELERIDVMHDVPESERICPCGTAMVEIGRDISEQLDIVPMQVRVLRHIRIRYGCLQSLHTPVTAALPPQPLPKSNASSDFLAMLLTVKFVDGLPLARFESVLARHGTPVPRQTLARWVIGASQLLQPLHNLMRDTLMDGPFIHMDETVVQVLKVPDKAPTSDSYMWVQVGGLPGKPVVLFDFDPSRSGAVPVRLLAGYRGYLMTDGYKGYNELVRTEEIEHLVCWAHARRNFVEAARVQAKGKRGRADEAIELIGQLYKIERNHKNVKDEERRLARQNLSLPVLEKLHAWLEKTLVAVPPKSALGSAAAYLRDYWSRLIRYTERGDLPIDNNRAEASIRPFVCGRKAWLFSDTLAGAHSSAIIYSLVETAKANGLEPYTWLRRVMRALPAAKTVEDIEALLPWNLHSQDLASELTP